MKEGKKEEAETARARVAELKEGNKELDAPYLLSSLPTLKLTVPSTKAKRVWSLPIPMFSPGLPGCFKLG